MKINELFEDKKPGTYSGVRFSPSTNKLIHQFINTYSIPNPVKANKLHSTVLYSRKHCPKYKARGTIHPALLGEAEEFVMWPSQEGKKCLVLKMKCPELVARHKELMAEHNATYDYPEYVPHITLSYDCGDDFNVTDLNAERALKSLAKLEIVEEYQQDLDEDWADKATKWGSK